VAGERLGLSAVRVAMADVVAGADLGRSPAQLQQQSRFAEQSAGGTLERRLVDKGEGGKGAEQQGVRQNGP
jgi:hypothetical protein